MNGDSDDYEVTTKIEVSEAEYSWASDRAMLYLESIFPWVFQERFGKLVAEWDAEGDEMVFESLLWYGHKVVAASRDESAIAEYVLPMLDGQPKRIIHSSAHGVIHDYFLYISDQWREGVKPIQEDELSEDSLLDMKRLMARFHREHAIVYHIMDQESEVAATQWSTPMNLTSFQKFLRERGTHMDEKTLRKALDSGTWRIRRIASTRFFQIALTDFPAMPVKE